jgi:hypothetical protein
MNQHDPGNAIGTTEATSRGRLPTLWGENPHAPTSRKKQRGEFRRGYHRIPRFFGAMEQMEKPWKIFGTFPTLHSKEFGAYTVRSDAENDAAKYQRILGKNITVRVVWCAEND